MFAILLSRDTCHATHGSFFVYGPVKNIQKSTMTKHILNNNNNMLMKHIKLNWFIETYWKQIEKMIEKNAQKRMSGTCRATHVYKICCHFVTNCRNYMQFGI